MTCTYCEGNAEIYCTRHAKAICADPYCVDMHRWDRKEMCDLMPIRPVSADRMDWLDIFVAAAVIVCAVAGLVVIAGHYWRVS